MGLMVLLCMPRFKQTVAEVIQLTGQQHRQLLHHMRLEQSAIRQQPFTPQQVAHAEIQASPEPFSHECRDSLWAAVLPTSSTSMHAVLCSESV